MQLDRRATVLLAVVFIMGVPAGILRGLCVGRACDDPQASRADVPFCSLPAEIRDAIAAGFREGRSPDVIAVTRADHHVWGDSNKKLEPRVPWPSVDQEVPEVPLVFAGTGVDPEAGIPPGTRLDAVAPTIAETIGLRRPHPEVRSGEAIDGVASGERPRLVLEVVFKSATSATSAKLPELGSLAEQGVGTIEATPGSLPVDPTAVLTTIGAGGMPNQHGITGAAIHNDDTEIVEPWTPAAPVSVIATLGDDLDEEFDQRPKIGLVAHSPLDRGLVGGDWYVNVDRDDRHVATSPEQAVETARRVLSAGYGKDATTDLLAVTLAARPQDMDSALGELVEDASRASGGSLLTVVTATGPEARPSGATYEAASVVEEVEARLQGRGVIARATSSGLFLDQDALVDTGTTRDQVTDALMKVKGDDGRNLFTDAFASLAVKFARYC